MLLFIRQALRLLLGYCGYEDSMSQTNDNNGQPYTFCGALCIDVLPGATSLRPYVEALARAADGREVQKVILLPPGLLRDQFITELSDLGAFDIGERKEMRRRLKEGTTPVKRHSGVVGAT